MTGWATTLIWASALVLAASCGSADKRGPRNGGGTHDPGPDPDKPPKPDPEVPADLATLAPEPPPELAASTRPVETLERLLAQRLRPEAGRLSFEPARDYPVSAAAFVAAAALDAAPCELIDGAPPIVIAPATCALLRGRDCLGQGLVHEAARRGDGALLDALRALSPALAATPDAEGRTPLLVAIGEGQAGAAEQLLAESPEAVQAVDHAERGPLHHLVLFATRGDLPRARQRTAERRLLALLLAAGADPTRRDIGGMSAHDLAIRGGHARLAGALPAAPADGAEASTLHLLARHGDRFTSSRELEALIARAAPDRAALEALSARELTPLGEAIVWGEGGGAEVAARALVKAARRHGLAPADLAVGPAFEGWSPVRLAVWRDAIPLARALVAAGLPSDPALDAATGASVDPASAGALGPDGQAPVHYAAWHGNIRWLEAALEVAPDALLTLASAEPPDPDVAGWTVWHFAAAAARVEALKRLGDRAGPPLRALFAKADVKDRVPASLRPWRRPLDASLHAVRRLADLRAAQPSMPTHGFGAGIGNPAGPGLVGIGGGDGDEPSWGSGLSHKGTGDDKPKFVLEEIAIEGRVDGPVFSVLGFGGAFQVREYPIDEERFGARLLEAPLPAMRGRGLPRRVPVELVPSRRAAGVCASERGWGALHRSGPGRLAALDLADPFLPELAAEAILLQARADSELGHDAPEALAAVASLDTLLLGDASALLLLRDELDRNPTGARISRAATAARARARAASAAAAGHGSLLLQRGRFDDAEQAFDRAVALARGTPDTLGLVLGQRAVLHTERGAWKAAIDDFAAARPLREAGFGPGSAEVVALDINEGVTLEAVARAEDAEARWTSALRAIAAGADVPTALFVALSANNLGRLALRRGDTDGAAAWVALAADALAAMPAPPAWLAGRVALSEGDLARLSPPSPDDDPGDDAHDAYTRAVERLRVAHGEDHPLVGRAVWRLAELEPDPEVRRAAYASAFVATRGAPDERWQLSHAWSRFEAAEGQEAAAYFLARAALEAIQQLRAEVRAVGAELEGGWLDARVEVFRHAAELALRLGRGGDATAILALKELETHLAFTRNAQVAGRAGAVPFDARERRQAALAKAASSLEASGVLTRAKEIRRFLAALEAERPTQRASSMVLAEQAKLARSLQDVLRRVDRRAVWLHLVPTARAVTAIITTASDQRVVSHAVEEGLVEARTVAFLDAIIERSPRPEVPAAALHALILAPFAAHLKDAPVVYIAADGVLRDLPFGALHDGQGWLIERHAFVTASMLTLHRMDREPPPVEAWRIGAFGVSQAHPGFPALPGVPAELAAIVASDARGRGIAGGTFPGGVRLDDAFRAETLLETLDEGTTPAIVIASHFKLGRADDDSFLLTGDGARLTVACMEDCTAECLPACADSASGFSFDGVHLVVLSACQTARQMTARREGRRRIADTQSSLADVAAVLGAHAVIGTLWPVNDPSTARWMGAFFRNLRGQGAREKARAMQVASVGMARGQDGDEAWRHPFYWAPFVLIGNAR